MQHDLLQASWHGGGSGGGGAKVAVAIAIATTAVTSSCDCGCGCVANLTGFKTGSQPRLVPIRTLLTAELFGYSSIQILMVWVF